MSHFIYQLKIHLHLCVCVYTSFLRVLVLFLRFFFSMREQMVLDEKVVGVELSGSKKQFKWPVNDPEKKTKETDDDDNESNDEMSALQKIFVVHSVSSMSRSTE